MVVDYLSKGVVNMKEGVKNWESGDSGTLQCDDTMPDTEKSRGTCLPPE
jgi:hypothetical protein